MTMATGGNRLTGVQNQNSVHARYNLPIHTAHTSITKSATEWSLDLDAVPL